MSKEIRLRCTDEVLAAADLAASRVGLTTSAYARMALLERMARDGIHPEQPRVD
jgi:antitoxin component of RelBE/YafQ-DinJ toxin-antitoxin module